MSTFGKRMKNKAEQVKSHENKAMRILGMETIRRLAIETPVDTGRARSNWLVGLGIPPTQEIEPYAAGTKGSTGAINSQMATDKGLMIISQYTRDKHEALYLRNNVNYINDLNAGTSRQAPSGYVNDAVKKAQESVKALRVLKP